MGHLTPISVGSRFNRWTVLRDLYKPRKRRYILCRCKCGVKRKVLLASLRNGSSQGCHCIVIKHGLTDTSTYRAWQAMKWRCRNPKNKRYGARGITVCKRWSRFENFLVDMGKRPKGKLLDRRNNDRGYYKRNCRWVTHKESTRNTSRTQFMTFKGKTQCLQDWADEAGLSRYIIASRLAHGWSKSRTLAVPKLVRTRWDTGSLDAHRDTRR